MSRTGQQPRTSKTGVGSSSRISQSKVSQGIRQSSTTNAREDTTGAPNQKKTKKTEKKAIEFQLPPLSIVGKKRELDFEAIRKKVVRRSNPEGEDKKELVAILKHLKESKARIKVHEFVSLVAKFTTDNGAMMRKVLEDDLAHFRKTVTKVYENMTQDVSDVLVNEQIQTSNYYQERYDMFNERMLWMISEIFQMIPEFDFEQYGKNKQDYLNIVCPLPNVVVRDAEEIDVQRRQEAFHRLQWLKIEGGRLADENKRLEQKLNTLMSEHAKNQTMANIKSKIMLERKQNLEEQEHETQEHLRELENAFAKSAVRAEAYVRLEEDEAIRLSKHPAAKTQKKGAKKKTVKRPEWCSITAADIEAEAAQQHIQSEMAAIDEKKRERWKRKEFSQTAQPRALGPAPARMQEKNIQQTTTMIQKRRNCPDRC